METASSPAGGFRGALARLRSAPLWVWITIILTFGLLIFAYLQYKKSNSSATTASTAANAAANGTVPLDGTGQPLWNTADQGAFTTGNQSELAAILAYIASLQTPNPPATATPNPPATTPTTPPATVPSKPPTTVPSKPPVTTPTSSAAKYFTITQNYSAANWQTTTLSGIAGMYHTSVSRLMQLNPQIKNPNLVYKGEKIRVA